MGWKDRHGVLLYVTPEKQSYGVVYIRYRHIKLTSIAEQYVLSSCCVDSTFLAV